MRRRGRFRNLEEGRYLLRLGGKAALVRVSPQCVDDARIWGDRVGIGGGWICTW